jgi:diguanylate cyclase (GGDEF)-like protein
MVLGHGPRIVPHAQNVPLFAASPIAQQVQIGAYIGVPLASTDGSLFGTLCAIDPNPQDESIRDELPLIEFLARLLGTVLVADLKAAKQARLLERSQQAARTDVLTGLLNRHGWEQSVATEEARAKRYGSPACVLIVDLDGLKQVNDTKGHVHGDALIRSASNSIKSVLRENDIVARIGGDEFAILGIECDAEGCEAIFKNVTNALLSNGISASVGKALRDHRLGLFEAIAAADRAMYVAKAKRRMRCSREHS